MKLNKKLFVYYLAITFTFTFKKKIIIQNKYKCK